MGSRAKKTVLVYTMLIMSTLVSECRGQLTQGGFVNPGTVGQTAKGFTTTNTFSTVGSNTWQPVNAVNSWNAHPASKGFYNTPGWNGYNQYPVNGQYWTGHQNMPHGQYPYTQYTYNNWQYPSQYGYYPQPYGYGHQQTGYSNYYGNYPNFDAGYWMGNAYHPIPAKPIYMPHQPAYIPHPVYHQPPVVHYVPVFYQGRWIQQPVYSYPAPNHYDRGFLGGTGGELAKGLLGALLVGTIAGKVARG